MGSYGNAIALDVAVDADCRSWDPLVLRFRKLREAFTATQAPPALRCEVYELSADVCAAARNMAELLKCLQQLVNSIYPAVCRGHAVTAAATAIGVANPTAAATRPERFSPASSPATSLGSGQALVSHLARLEINPSATVKPILTGTCSNSSSNCPRLAEVSSALLLYFACVPRQPVVQELVKQSKAASKLTLLGHSTPQQGLWPEAPQQQQQQQGRHGTSWLLLHTPEYQQALRAVAAVMSTHWLQFMHIYHVESPPALVKAVMRCHLERLRMSVVRAAVATYRMLPSDVLLRWLALTDTQQQQQQLIGILQHAVAGGCRGAQVAVQQCLGHAYAAGDQQENGSPVASELPAVLQFRGP